MTLEDLGYRSEYKKVILDQGWDSFELGRISQEHKERYNIISANNEFEAEITGNLRFSAKDRSDFPAVGDWVVFSKFDEDSALIHNILPRKTVLERQAVGKFGEKQIIATNIDKAFIIQGLDRDFNINRIERYLTIVNNAGVDPIIILSKTDLISDEELKFKVESLKYRIKNTSVIAISNLSKTGIEGIRQILTKGLTFCCLGSSGVGKSTLVNTLAGESLLKTNDLSISTNKGKHTTSHRELIVLETGGILIDTPGMREIGITESSEGLEISFESIIRLAKLCAFKDCTHMHEENCEVKNAILRGDIDPELLENYLKMQRENQHFATSISEKRKKGKVFGKMIKNVIKFKKDNKYR